MRASPGWAWVASGIALAVGLLNAGCGVLSVQRTDFPFAATGDSGHIYRDDIDKILNDATLTPDQKRQALRDLGIEDEDLLDALLAGGG